MNTYLLIATRNKAQLKKLAEKSEYHYIYKERAVMVFNGEFEPPEKMVVKTIKGNQGEAYHYWARRTILDELSAEHINRQNDGKPITTRERSSVISSYTKLRQRREKIRAELDRLDEEMDEASKTLVRTLGLGPIVIDDETLDVSYRGNTVFYIRRKGGSE